jgi:hypothetical protein
VFICGQVRRQRGEFEIGPDRRQWRAHFVRDVGANSRCRVAACSSPKRTRSKAASNAASHRRSMQVTGISRRPPCEAVGQAFKRPHHEPGENVGKYKPKADTQTANDQQFDTELVNQCLVKRRVVLHD